MKKTLLTLLILFSAAPVYAAPAGISDTCLNNPSACTQAENAILDGQTAVQNSAPNNQGQAAQFTNQGKNATANPATQAVYSTTQPQTTNPTPTNGNCPNGQPQQVDNNGKPLGCDLGYTPLEPIPGVTTNTNGGAMNFATLLGSIYKIAITIGALFSVLMLTVSGIR